MPLNPNYVPLTPLWELHSDKDTGNFLRNGYVKFFRDTARTVGKPVYQLTGSPPNYTYTQYGFMDIDGSWRVNLNDQGAFGQVVYGYPLDLSSNVDLYFIQFYSSTGVFQFSREGWPNFFESGGNNGTQVNVNYIPNGQFRLHTDIPATDTLTVGEVRAPVTNVAFGGWTFERPPTSTARDFVTFQRFGSYVATPDKSPRYAMRIKCENPSGGDQFKDVRVKFDDVNKFSSDTEFLTFAVSGQVMSGGSINVDLILIKNFGTGGDSATETNIATFNITSSFTILFDAFTFGNNAGKIIGTLNDDYIQLALRFPPNSIFDAEITDVILTPGNISSPIFDDTTTRQFIYRSIFDDICPSLDGSDIGLPMVLTKTGLQFDDSQVGNIVASTQELAPFGYLLADGSQYETIDYSSDGIPYSRLQNKWFNPLTGIPKYGTGKNYVTSYFTNVDSTNPNSSLRIINNAIGTATNFSDGTPATGFTFTSVTVGTASQFSWGLYYGTASFYIWGQKIGSVTQYPGIFAGTSGFTVSAIRVTNPAYNAALVKSIYSVTAIAASSITPGSYFEYENTTTTFAIWFKVNGVGTAPSLPGITLIEVDLLSTFDAEEVAKICASTISGLKITNAIAPAGSAIPTGSYWNLNTATQQYYVWYKKDGAGTDPAPSGKLGIEVDILSSDTAQIVGSKTLFAINSKYLALPDLRGMFLRGWDNGANIDTDSASRWSFYNSDLTGDLLGTFEFDEVYQHTHIQSSVSGGGSQSGNSLNSTSGALGEQGSTYYSGGSESRPINAYVNYVIKY
jgi:hypothetical protein